MNHIPWVILGAILSPFGAWLAILASDWWNNRKRERRWQEWQRRNQQ